VKKIVFSLILIAGALVALTWYRSTRDAKPLENTIIVGTSADYPPFSLRDKDLSIVGFDIDIVKEVAKRLGMEVSLQDKPFGLLLPQLELGQIHMIAAGMTPTEERAKRINFTKPYLKGNPLLVVILAKNPPITSLEDLKGKEVIVNTGYTADTFMSKIPDIHLIRLGKLADALLALENGKAYAFVTAAFTLEPYLKEHDKDRTKFNIFKLIEADEETALALSKILPAHFLPKVQEALDAMEADGTLPSLRQKWGLI
jgi:arginine/lysine/histidine transporter system substrate-binding protein